MSQLTRTEFVRELLALGFYFVREGKHGQIWQHPDGGRIQFSRAKVWEHSYAGQGARRELERWKREREATEGKEARALRGQ